MEVRQRSAMRFLNCVFWCRIRRNLDTLYSTASVLERLTLRTEILEVLCRKHRETHTTIGKCGPPGKAENISSSHAVIFLVSKMLELAESMDMTIILNGKFRRCDSAKSEKDLSSPRQKHSMLCKMAWPMEELSVECTLLGGMMKGSLLKADGE